MKYEHSDVNIYKKVLKKPKNKTKKQVATNTKVNITNVNTNKEI